MWRSYNSRLGVWGIENHGVDPDVPVRITQADAVSGRDPQLEKAIDVALAALEKRVASKGKRPAMPVHPRR
jgi:tricorn protease